MLSHDKVSRRHALLAMAAAPLAAAAPAAAPEIDRAVIERNDRAVERFLLNQVTSQTSPHRGGVPDEYLLHHVSTAGSLIETLAAALVCPQSRFYTDSGTLMERIELAAGFLERSQSPEGNIDLLSTNFNSPPDTGFLVHNVATAAALGRLYGNPGLVRVLRPFLLKAGAGMASGGIHTPNHRWVVSSALAQIHEIFPSPAFTKRIDQWLAEGIDIDEDGQFIERSTVTYNTVCDRAFTVLAAKLKRPALLDPVRKNLNAMLYLMHPDGEVVTEVSRRQDQFTRGTMAGYWFPAAYLAAHDQDGVMASLVATLAGSARLSALLEYPELADKLPAAKPLPDSYERQFPLLSLARIRRGKRDATLVLGESSRFFSARNGAAVINAVRFATSFFGKGQFAAQSFTRAGESYVLRQSLEAPYYQPVAPARKVDARNWAAMRARRKQTQVCRLEQSATITERDWGFHLRIESKGTAGVPLAVEISLREGGKLEGCRPAPRAADCWIVEKDFATYTAGADAIRIGPGAAPHLETQLRGAEPKLPGTSLYVTGITPFDHSLELRFT